MTTDNLLHVHAPTWKDGVLTCTFTAGEERLVSSYDFPAGAPATLDETAMKLCEWMAIITSLSSYSIAYFTEIVCDFPLNSEEIAFFETLFFHGLGEFRLVNNIPLSTRTRLRGNGKRQIIKPPSTRKKSVTQGPLLLNGGGKDGSVSAQLLTESNMPFTWFQRGDSVAQRDVTGVWEAPVFVVTRHLDPKRLNRRYSGHRPMSAGIAILALLSAHLYNYSDVIASNEASANEGNAEIDGFTVNHQYSKSFAFERDMQHLLDAFGIDVHYFSLLRPLHELQIAFLATRLKPAQLEAITSCNNGTSTGTWCMSCAKCAFVALVITAADPSAAAAIWGDSTALCTPGLRKHLIALLDPGVDKPLECVGTLDECQLAAYLVLARHDLALDEPTRTLLTKYATSRNDSLLTTLLPSAIPAAYQNIEKHIQEILDETVSRLTI